MILILDKLYIYTNRIYVSSWINWCKTASTSHNEKPVGLNHINNIYKLLFHVVTLCQCVVVSVFGTTEVSLYTFDPVMPAPCKIGQENSAFLKPRDFKRFNDS